MRTLNLPQSIYLRAPVMASLSSSSSASGLPASAEDSGEQPPAAKKLKKKKKSKKKSKSKASAMSPAKKRLMRDFQKIMREPPQGVSASPVDMNIFQWQAVMFGPEDTAWEGGTFNLLIDFTEEYPSSPPTVRFVTKMFHPNVYNDGRICIDILKSQWSPIYDTSAILLSIQSLLNDPNPASPANEEAARLFQNDRREYSRRVRLLVQENTAKTAAANAAGVGESKD